MTELSGTLEGVGLPAIIRFLTGLKKTGCLRIVHADWQGEILFDAGQLTGASFGSRQGLAALDALVEVLPGGGFTFDTSVRAPSAPTIELSPAALQAHFDELVARGTRRLPTVDEVPELLAGEANDAGGGEEPLPLDRGTLQTLLAVDGQRTVRQIVAHRGTFDALWQLGNLAEVGLVRVASTGVAASPATPATPASVVSRAVVEPPRVEPVTVVAARCPKLGFDDDPSNSIDRPTRLHRCFAAATPLPLSLDQQRELCLSDQFGTCPRLSLSGRNDARPAAPPARGPLTPPTPMGRAGNPASTRGAGGNAAPAMGTGGRSDALRAEPEADDPRIVRLPFGGRNNPATRGGGGDRQAGGSSEPPQLLSSSSTLRTSDSPRPTPLRARIDRASSAAASAASPAERAAGEPDAPPTQEQPRAMPRRLAQTYVDGVPPFRFSDVPVRLLVGLVVLLTLLAVSAYLLVPHLGELFGDDNADLSGLPNASAVAAGTPVAAIAARLTPAPSVALTSQGASASAANPVPAPAEPTLVPEAAPATAVPARAASPVPAVQPAATVAPAFQPAATVAPAVQPAPTVAPAAASPAALAPVLDERFINNTRNWPSNPQGTAWVTSGSYRLIPRQAGQFVAVGAPLPDLFQDVVVTASFRKLSGTPAGGGFGVIVRDQGPGPRDGINQGGQYYVLEVGDRGEVGIWRREQDHWVDILPWQHADAVHPGPAANEVTASAIGNRLTLAVNGTQVATRTDDTLKSGTVGLLTGGDGNQVAVDHYAIQTP